MAKTKYVRKYKYLHTECNELKAELRERFRQYLFTHTPQERLFLVHTATEVITGELSKCCCDI